MPGSARRLALAVGLFVVLPTLAGAQQTTSREVPRGQGAQHGAQTPCGQRADVVKMLKENFGERAMAHGLAHSGSLAAVFISPNGSWTIIATSPNGISCMIGSGDSWKTTLAADEST